MTPAIEPTLRDVLLELWRMNARARGIQPSMVSRYAYGDVDFFERLEQQARDDRIGNARIGRQRASVTVRKFDELIAYFHDPSNWPEGKVPSLPQIKVTKLPAKTNVRKAPSPDHRARRRDNGAARQRG